jgi:hypothetical protein
MGMYVCIKHQEEYGLKERFGATNLALCEICGNVDGDWEERKWVIYTWDVQRPIMVKDNKEYVQSQLDKILEKRHNG